MDMCLEHRLHTWCCLGPVCYMPCAQAILCRQSALNYIYMHCRWHCAIRNWFNCAQAQQAASCLPDRGQEGHGRGVDFTLMNAHYLR
eukprot:6191435-Pleurochrysis_carterae.AAC.2